jgi:ferredoxin
LSNFFSKIFGKESKALPGMNARFFASVNCDGCGECERRCPTGHIKMIDGKPEWFKPCLLCAACSTVCPENAILYGTPKEMEEYRRLVNEKINREKDL